MKPARLVLCLTVCSICILGETAGLPALPGQDKPGAGDRPARTDPYGDPLPPGALARLGSIRLRHAADVRSVAFSPDGKAVISADPDWTHRWDTTTGKRLASFRSPAARLGAAVTSPLLALSPDGRLLVTVVPGKDRDDRPGKVVLRETAGGKVRAELKGNQLLTQLSSGCLAFSLDGKLLAVGDLNDVLQLYDTATGRELRKIEGTDRQFQHVAFSPDGKVVATAPFRGGVTFWETGTGAKGRTLPMKDARVAALAFAPDGKSLLTGTEEGNLQLWDRASGKELRAFQDKKREQPLSFLFLVFSPDGRYVAVGDVYNSSLLLWDATTGKVARQLEGIAGPCCAAFSRDGKTLVTGDGGHLVRLWEVSTGKERRLIEGASIVLGPVALSPDGKTLATQGPDSTLHLRTFPGGKSLRSWRVKGGVYSLAFSPREGLLVTGGHDGTLRFWDPATGKEWRKVPAHRYERDGKVEPRSVAAVAFSPDGKTLASGGEDSLVRLWDVGTGKLQHTLKGRRGWVDAVAFSPDGKLVAGGGCTDDSLDTCLWDAKTGKLVRTFREGQAGSFAMALAFSRDNKVLAAAGGLFGGWYVTFVDVATGKGLAERNSLQAGVQDEFYAAAVSPDGRTLALGSARGIALWDMATRKEVRQIRGEFGACTSLAFARDGRTLVAAHGDGTVLFWDIAARARGKAPQPHGKSGLDRGSKP
jgi:WD40 repeat protein